MPISSELRHNKLRLSIAYRSTFPACFQIIYMDSDCPQRPLNDPIQIHW